MPSQTCNLGLSSGVQENVLGLQISVGDFVGVQEVQALHHPFIVSGNGGMTAQTSQLLQCTLQIIKA